MIRASKCVAVARVQNRFSNFHFLWNNWLFFLCNLYIDSITIIYIFIVISHKNNNRKSNSARSGQWIINRVRRSYLGGRFTCFCRLGVSFFSKWFNYLKPILCVGYWLISFYGCIYTCTAVYNVLLTYWVCGFHSVTCVHVCILQTWCYFNIG